MSRRLLVVNALAGVAAVLLTTFRPEWGIALAAAFAVQAALLPGLAWAAERRARQADVERLEARLERRVAEVAVERLRMERLLQRLPLAVLLFTPSGLAYANPAARELFPVASEGRSPLRALAYKPLADTVAEARELGRTVHLDVERDGRWLSVRALVTAEGEVALVLADQTEARRVEVVRRDFVINASHELKTPVAAMQALADSLAMALAREPARAAPMVSRLTEEAARLGQLVRDLLDLARLEEQEAERRERVDLAALAREQAARLQPDAVQRQVEVTVDVPEGLSLVAVPEDVGLLLGNLIENAVRYNRPGGRVLVRARRSDGEVVIEVVDTGIGLADADRGRIFERFYRVDRARSRAEGGTGLGLAIVRHAAERHGGTVAIDSVLGEGSTFRVTLPAVSE